MTDFIYISQLPWSVVRNYPNHVPWRFLRQRRVVFVETPLPDKNENKPRLQIQTEYQDLFADVTIVRLIYPAHLAQCRDFGHPIIQPIYNRLLKKYLTLENFQTSILWLCTPTATDFADAIPYSLRVLDGLNRIGGVGAAAVKPVNEETVVLRK